MDHSPQATVAEPVSRNRQAFHWILRGVLFFLICLGLGYPAVQRYDPRQTEGLSDTAIYYRMVAGEQVEAREMRFRVLVPYLARPFYSLTRKFLDPPRAVYLALLISNALFSAISACLVVALGLRITRNTATAMLAATLYLLNFAVLNLHLAALVDAGEACFLVAVTLSLLSGRWWLLPIWGVLGALSKETFVPLAAISAIIWWFAACRNDSNRLQKFLPIVVMLFAALATMIILRITIAGTIGTSAILEQTHAGAGGFAGRFSVFFTPSLWYVFVWLLPLGLLRLNHLPWPWVLASLGGSVTVLALSIYRDIGGNAARPLFAVLGPLLSLGAAIWLTRAGSHSTRGVTPDFKS